MEVSSQNGFKCDEEKALNSLLDAFGSAFSLEEIASAFCKANRDADLAGVLLSDMQVSSSTSTTNSPDADARVEACAKSSDGFSSNNSSQERYSKDPKPKSRPVSVGTVSSRLGKDYVRSIPSSNRSHHGTTKPLKLDANLLEISEIPVDDCEPNISNHNQLHQDMEDFLFKMLGDGFQLDREKIREVLDNCGYDMKKSMDKLMGESILTSDKVACVVGGSSGRSTDREPKSEVLSYERKSQNVCYPGRKVSSDGVDLNWQRKDREELQQEVLTSLFQVREHSEESPKRIIEGGKKLSPYRKVVNEPPEDSPEEYEIDTNYLGQENIGDPEDEDDYQNLRKAAKEYRAIVIEYNRAAVDAFVKGDRVKAKKLLEEGQPFLTKAREADEESNKMIVETKNGESQEFVVDLRHLRQQGPKEILRAIKCHLSLSAAFKYLKVIIDESNQDFSEGSSSQKRKRRIVKLLEKESLAWDEGETVGTILVCLDKIGHTKA